MNQEWQGQAVKQFDPDIQAAMERIQELRREGALLGISQITLHFNADNGTIKRMQVNRSEPVSGEIENPG